MTATVSKVGIIANPASGKDIRRLIASGTVVTNQEKINTVVRMLKAMDALGVAEVQIMPDPSHLGQRVINEIADELKTTKPQLLSLPYLLGTWKDSHRAAELMSAQGCACIIVMGGDGTSRIVTRACGNTPLLPVSTGTNNVFPQMVEGTLAGMAAGLLATNVVPATLACRRAPVLELCDADGETLDLALVDLVVLDSHDLGSRAVWEEESIHELFMTQAQPTQIGLSAIGAWVEPLSAHENCGLYVSLDPLATQKIMAPIAPGLMREVGVAAHRRFSAGEQLPVTLTPSVVALDGEREVIIPAGIRHSVRYQPNGPLVVEIERCLLAGAEQGALRRLSKSREFV
jgi:predicted polyphosphate/ATP-dependent NAD kinase